MADISADGLLPSGDFRPTNLPAGAVISSGVTGTLVTIPAPTGGRVRLVCLFANTAQPGISIICDGVTVASNRTIGLQSGTDATTLVIGASSAVGVAYVEARTSIVISKNAGNTTANLSYVAVEGI
jgi:hypothetical protein